MRIKGTHLVFFLAIVICGLAWNGANKAQAQDAEFEAKLKDQKRVEGITARRSSFVRQIAPVNTGQNGRPSIVLNNTKPVSSGLIPLHSNPGSASPFVAPPIRFSRHSAQSTGTGPQEFDGKIFKSKTGGLDLSNLGKISKSRHKTVTDQNQYFGFGGNSAAWQEFERQEASKKAQEQLAQNARGYRSSDGIIESETDPFDSLEGVEGLEGLDDLDVELEEPRGQKKGSYSLDRRRQAYEERLERARTTKQRLKYKKKKKKTARELTPSLFNTD